MSRRYIKKIGLPTCIDCNVLLDDLTWSRTFKRRNKWQCTSCDHIYYNKYMRKNIIKGLHYRAKNRATRLNIPFNIEMEDIILPEYCPVLGIKLVCGNEDLGSSPSLDRIVPELGYVKDNIVVISHRANTIKNNATKEEIRKVSEWLNKINKINE